ncbi:M48 family metallopeptidase [Aliiroseovarius sp. F20344]|uniref:M48 family metallopeptidase n=1 Tax=Aliiroseovarius sp. F20344 TaxID=2926414 RepID=UPI001FF6D66E|nr:M48 family metallopeptidase [Aliiroseovarius sp. F20344]MCK0143538.1 M48 family metallopeptidase [Aliiroseovarius sp. F20344]
MTKLLPILLPLIYGLILYRFSVWRTHRELDSKSTRLADPVLKAKTDQMAKTLDLADIPVHIYEIQPVNGLAAPDGRIFITRGFYDEYRQGRVTADEIASVIAHELGHVALGHARKRMIDFSGQNALRTVLTMMISRFLPGAGVYVARILTKMVAAGLSRGDEYEADAYATALLIKSGIGSDGQKSLFDKLDTLTQSRAGVMPAWLMSHPKSADRIAAIEKNEAKWG